VELFSLPAHDSGNESKISGVKAMGSAIAVGSESKARLRSIGVA